MKILKLIGYYFIFIAIGMFGGGGIIVFEILDPISPAKWLFVIMTVIGCCLMMFNIKKLSSAEKELKRLES